MPVNFLFTSKHCVLAFDKTECRYLASWSSGRSFWLLIMRSRVRFPVVHWGFFLEGEDSHGELGLRSSVEFRFKAPLGTSYSYTVSPSTSSGQRNCASWTSQPPKSVTLRPQLGGETTKSIRDTLWNWKRKYLVYFSIQNYRETDSRIESSPRWPWSHLQFHSLLNSSVDGADWMVSFTLSLL
jgi:hypothetical protein